MEFTFFIAGIIALAATLRTVTCSHPVHALLYLIVSLLSIAVIFYALGAEFAATLEVIVYAGAIMVLFVFVVMMLNLNHETVARERQWIRPKMWIGPGVCATVLLIAMIWFMMSGGAMSTMLGKPLSANAVGRQLFGPYILVTELAAFLLLAALAVAGHIGRNEDRLDAVQTLNQGERSETTEAGDQQ